MGESLKSKTLRGTIWTGLETFSMRAISFLVTIFMARILTPSDYGLIGMITIFISISNSLIDSGFSQALIRKNQRNNKDYNTVFYFNIFIGSFLYIVLYLCAPFISKFYAEPELTPITRVIGLSLILNSLSIVQSAIFTHSLNFKTPAKISICSSIISGIVGISLAFMDYGVWAIVWQQLSKYTLYTILLWLFAKWIPQFEYSWKSFRELFGFGSKLMASGLIDTTYNNIYGIVIGKVFKAADLGFYSRAASFPDLASPTLTSIIQRVTFPVMSKVQLDDSRLTDIYRRIIRTSGFIIFPLVLLIAALGKPMIITILTEKWLFSSVLLIPICFSSMWYPIHALNLNVLKVKGRSDLFLKLEIIKKLEGIVLMCITVPFGLYAMCWGGVASSIIALIINTYYTGILINVGFFKQIRDLLPTFSLSLIMAILVYTMVTLIDLPAPVLFVIGGFVGIFFYVMMAKLFRMKELYETISFFKSKK